MADREANSNPKTQPCAFKFGGAAICPRPAVEGDTRCILHKRERSPEEAEAFAEEVRGMLRDKEYDFRGVVFPDGFGGLSRAVFDGPVDFSRARFQGDAEFTRARFTDRVIFNDAFIRGAARFNAAVFQKNANFVKTRIGGDALFTEAEIQGAGLFSALDVGGSARFHNVSTKNLIQFGGARVGGALVFTRSEIGASATFAHTVVGGEADFSGVRIGDEGDFSHMTVGGDAQFSGAQVARDVNLRGAIVRGNLLFRGAVVRGNGRFVGVEVARNAMFSETKIGERGEWRRMDVSGRAYFSNVEIVGSGDFRAMNAGMFVHFGNAVFNGSVEMHGAMLPPAGDFAGVRLKMGRSPSFCRFAKQVCQNMGEYREAGAWHYKERCHHWYERVFLSKGSKSLAALVNPLTWLEYLLGRWVFGYGESPTRVIVTMFLVIFGCAWGYRGMGGIWHGMNEALLSGFADSLYFSVVVFATLGFGDYQPVPGDSPVRYLVMAETMAGAFLMALLVVTLARRWGRG